MDDSETLLRRARLRELIDVCFDGKDVLLLDFIERKTGKRPNQGELSALQKDNGGKSFGDKKARALAGQIGLDRYWFTMPVGANTSREHWLSTIPTEWSREPQKYAAYQEASDTGSNTQPIAVAFERSPRQRLVDKLMALVEQIDDSGLENLIGRAELLAEQQPLIRKNARSSG